MDATATAAAATAAASVAPTEPHDTDGAVEMPRTPPMDLQARGAPTLTPESAATTQSAVVLDYSVVPGISIKMSAKEAKRARRSEIERKSRQRRQGSVSGMRAELERLERHYALLTSTDDHASRGTIMHPGQAAQLRARFRQLSQEAAALRDEHKSLRVMLHERQLFSDSVCALLTQFSEDDEFAYHAVKHATYEPLPVEKCFEIMRDALDTIAHFDNDRNFVTSGSSVMGWTDRRRLDEENALMHFSFDKRFTDVDPLELLNASWEMFCDERAMRKTIFTASVHVTLETLQKVSDDILIMRRHTKYVAMQKAFHTVYLLFRVRTERGYTLCFRTILCPSVQNSMEEGEAWIEIFHWTQITILKDDTTHDSDSDTEEDANVVTGRRPIEISFGGSLGGSVIKFAMHWMIELIMTVVRWESACIAPLFIKSSSD